MGDGSFFRYPGGILHTKSWSVDGQHFYIGSANFDWRSLTHVKELGIAAFNCPCLGDDLKKLLEIYWRMGAPGAKIPKQWDDDLSTAANHQSPMSIMQPSGSQAIYISVSDENISYYFIQFRHLLQASRRVDVNMISMQ